MLVDLILEGDLGNREVEVEVGLVAVGRVVPAGLVTGLDPAPTVVRVLEVGRANRGDNG